MFVIDNGYAYQVISNKGYKIDFDEFGQMSVDTSDSIDISTQRILNYNEMFKKMNFAKEIEDKQKERILENTNLEIFSDFFDKVKLNSLNRTKFKRIVENTVIAISDYEDDVVITFDKNGGTGEMKPVRKEVGDEYLLPECAFTAPEGKQFANWDIDGTNYDPNDEITVSESITVTAEWDTIPPTDPPTEPPTETPTEP